MSSAPDHLYLDLSIVNNDTSGDSTIPLNFREFRTNPILDNPANYFMSVARFEVDTPGFSLPMFIPKLRLDGQNENINSTAYSVSMAIIDRTITPNVLTGLAQRYVEWSPQDKTAALPNNKLGPIITERIPDSGSVGLYTSLDPYINPTPFDLNTLNSVQFLTDADAVLDNINWSIALQTNPIIADAVRNYPAQGILNSFLIYYQPPAGGGSAEGAYIELGGGGATLSGGSNAPTGFASRIYEFDSTINPSVATTAYTNKVDLSIPNIPPIVLTPYNPNVNPQFSGIQTIAHATNELIPYYTYRFYINTIAGQGAGNLTSNLIITNQNLTQAPTNAYKLASYSRNQNQPPTSRISFNTNPLIMYEFATFPDNLPRAIPLLELNVIQYFNLIYDNIVEQRNTIVSQDISTGYYNCYSAKWWLSCVNKALADCYNSMGTLENPPVANGYAPQFVIDADTNLITLMNPYIQTAVDGTPPLLNFAIGEDVASQSDYLGSPAGVTSRDDIITHSIFFNESLFNLFSSLNSIYYGSKFPPSSLSVGSQGLVDVIPEGYKIFSNYIQSLNYNLLNTQTTTDPRTSVSRRYILAFSEYSPVPMWNPIQSIVFTTSMIPIHYSMSNPPQVYGSTQYDQTYTTGGGNNSDISTQISDIQIPLTTGNEYRPTITYTPRGEYRMIDLLGNLPINEIGFAISYKTKFGQIIPFALGPQCGANLKILFRRKRYNLGNVFPYDTN